MVVVEFDPRENDSPYKVADAIIDNLLTKTPTAAERYIQYLIKDLQYYLDCNVD